MDDAGDRREGGVYGIFLLRIEDRQGSGLEEDGNDGKQGGK